MNLFVSILVPKLLHYDGSTYFVKLVSYELYEEFHENHNATLFHVLSTINPGPLFTATNIHH